MASSSSSSSHKKYHVFPSFHGKDVRRTFLSHFLRELERNGIETFKDHEIERSETIGPELARAIRESRIYVVVLSKSYPSSSWCLNELLEIMKCRKAEARSVMTIFYDVYPSDVRKQLGDFGRAFEETCFGRTKSEKERWRRALNDAAGIAGYDSHQWDNEAHMIEKIVADISNKLNFTPSKDFENIVGIDAHIASLSSLLCSRTEEAVVVGIWGPAGIGKTTIARALYNRIRGNFQRSCFMEDVKASNKLDSYCSKLNFQRKLLSQILDQENVRVDHLGAVRERLENQNALIVLDDVDDIEQLSTLANHARWFGSGSRIIVTTRDRRLLRKHGITRMYEVEFPSRDEALQIFCRYAFGKNSPPSGFRNLAAEVVSLAGHLPLGLKVLGSFSRGMDESEWMQTIPILRTRLDGEIEKSLRISYDGLNDDDKATFLHIACLFNGENVDRVVQLLAHSGLHVDLGLKVLSERSLIHISTDINRRISMHDLVQQLGREIVRKQSILEPGKRQFLVDADEICDVLTDNSGTETVLGISLDMSKIDNLYVDGGLFEKMINLRFLRFFMNPINNKNVGMRLLKGLDYLPRKLRLLQWDACPIRRMPRRFRPEFLVELTLRQSKLEKLWDGIQPLKNLKKMDLSRSENLRRIPDLSEAKELERLDLSYCASLVVLPSSIKNLNKLKVLRMDFCRKLTTLPANMDLECLEILYLGGCSRLKTFPEVSTNITYLCLDDTAIEEVPSSIRSWSRLDSLVLSNCKNLRTFPYVPSTVTYFDYSNTRI
ncbi:PREDICTED: putative disease resistance protein At4g11170 [Tarenaya hassleriana]|uniref:putative disease resistance protein At4g11170 n=1 Tax=Tarenaya hassleriana TaxID=28532 RepID=UPI00053C61D5|nr:PREDICTED: putative disease resistance protein At4g11170 [Tarenaya hassleriana]